MIVDGLAKPLTTPNHKDSFKILGLQDVKAELLPPLMIILPKTVTKL